MRLCLPYFIVRTVRIAWRSLCRIGARLLPLKSLFVPFIQDTYLPKACLTPGIHCTFHGQDLRRRGLPYYQLQTTNQTGTTARQCCKPGLIMFEELHSCVMLPIPVCIHYAVQPNRQCRPWVHKDFTRRSPWTSVSFGSTFSPLS